MFKDKLHTLIDAFYEPSNRIEYIRDCKVYDIYNSDGKMIHRIYDNDLWFDVRLDLDRDGKKIIYFDSYESKVCSDFYEQ